MTGSEVAHREGRLHRSRYPSKGCQWRVARPSDPLIADFHAFAKAGGETLRAICRDEGMPDERTVRRWALDDVEGFAGHYAKAREVGYQSLADELLEIADDLGGEWGRTAFASIPANGCSRRRSPRSTATSSRSSVAAP